jgi:putative toxin-antitoxin system antitoxin component (TIGR02293 family)
MAGDRCCRGVWCETMPRRAQLKTMSNAGRVDDALVGRVFEQAKRVLGSAEAARLWMRSDLPSLGNRNPLELLCSIEGYERVRAVLGRVESGTF